jgi:hypothetical protein
MNQRETSLKELDEACEKCMEENGTLKTGMTLNYYLQRQVDKCNAVGCKRDEITAILTKYSLNEKRRA